MTDVVHGRSAREMLSPFTSNLQQQPIRNYCILTHDVTRRRRSYTPSLHRLVQNFIIIISLIHPLLLLLMGSTKSVCAATFSSLPVIEKEGRTAAVVVGIDKIAPVSLGRNDMLDDESMMDYPFNIFREEEKEGQCMSSEQQQYFGGGNNNVQSILSNHDYSTTAENKITRMMNDVQAPSSLE